jgi:hypothetical protein
LDHERNESRKFKGEDQTRTICHRDRRINGNAGFRRGLGNIWKFPYLTGANGGAAFSIVYLLCTLLVGYPIMIAEQMIGRKGREMP